MERWITDDIVNNMTDEEKRKMEMSVDLTHPVIPELNIGPWKIDKSGWYFQGFGTDEYTNEQVHDYIKKRKRKLTKEKNKKQTKKKPVIEHVMRKYVIDGKTVVKSWVYINVCGKYFCLSYKSLDVD